MTVDTKSPVESLYLNVVLPLNEDFAELRGYLKTSDTRVKYLKTFEMSLSTCIREYPLWEDKKYLEHLKNHAMPDDEYTLLDFDEFRAWMAVYEMIMREHHLIGMSKKQEAQVMGLSQYRKGGT
jgi:hypothetical protein